MTAKKPRRGRVLPEHGCVQCGTLMLEKRGTLTLLVHGEQVSVPGIKHLCCPQCGGVLLRFEDSKALSAGALARYNKKHGKS
jgi:YgiT-type zinc finger domain-containing protein